jgi:hypothetical protein
MRRRALGEVGGDRRVAARPGAASIAALIIGGMITAPLLSMFVIPAAYLLMRRTREGRATRLVFWRRNRAVA